MSLATKTEIKSISLHNPSVHGKYPLFKGMINAYDKTIFSDENYISDSCFDFRGKDPFKFIENIQHGVVQILLHPLHFSEEGWGYDDIFYNSFKRHLDSVQSNFMENKTFKQQIRKSGLELIKK